MKGQTGLLRLFTLAEGRTVLRAKAKSARSTSLCWEEKSLVSSASSATHGGVARDKLLNLLACFLLRDTGKTPSSWKAALKAMGTRYGKHLSRCPVHRGPREWQRGPHKGLYVLSAFRCESRNHDSTTVCQTFLSTEEKGKKMSLPSRRLNYLQKDRRPQ